MSAENSQNNPVSLKPRTSKVKYLLFVFLLFLIFCGVTALEIFTPIGRKSISAVIELMLFRPNENSDTLIFLIPWGLFVVGVSVLFWMGLGVLLRKRLIPQAHGLHVIAWSVVFGGASLWMLQTFSVWLLAEPGAAEADIKISRYLWQINPRATLDAQLIENLKKDVSISPEKYCSAFVKNSSVSFDVETQGMDGVRYGRSFDTKALLAVMSVPEACSEQGKYQKIATLAKNFESLKHWESMCPKGTQSANCAEIGQSLLMYGMPEKPQWIYAFTLETGELAFLSRIKDNPHAFLQAYVTPTESLSSKMIMDQFNTGKLAITDPTLYSFECSSGRYQRLSLYDNTGKDFWDVYASSLAEQKLEGPFHPETVGDEYFKFACKS